MKLSELKYIADYERVSVKALMVLLVLRDHGGRMRFDDVARELDMLKPGLSRAFDRLGIEGLIYRDRDLEDGRLVWAVLTPLGRKVVSVICGG